ncbi:MAG: hypothetical protein KGO81_14760 [Bacteroidota bacterium]|nr:hypothetical protein [Bacteroidota bacterium]
MATKISIVLLTCFLIGACKKDQYTTRPQLTLKSVSSTSLHQGDVLNFDIDFTDKEGDIQDSIWIQRISSVCPGTFASIFQYKMPDFSPTKDLKGTISIGFIYNVANDPYYPYLGSCANKVDTSIFKFWLKDLGGHVSDTITSPKIIFN